MLRRLIVAAAMVALCAGGAGVRAQDTAAPSSRWPMQVQSADGLVTMYQPQLEDFNGDQISARAAVSIAKPGQQEPIFGAVWLHSRVSTDRTARTVRILDVSVTKTLLPGTDPATEQTLAAAIHQVVMSQPINLSLDQLLAMVQTLQKAQAASAELKNDPPAIIFREHRAVKVQFDGAPRLVQAPDSPVMRVINTPFFVALDPASKTYFLKGGGRWFSAPDALGPYQGAAQVPPAVSALADAEGYKDPQNPISDADAVGLEIVTATEPTELIWTDGPPEMGTIAGTGLLYLTNTESDVFLTIDSQQMYVLLSGRWYVAPNRNGPWAYVAPDKLPDDFRHIPANCERADVLAHVPGTQAAQDAVADAEIPQTAAVNLQQFDQPPVQYDGDPNFQPVEGTPMTYAVNTDACVLGVGGQYYCCYNAAWYNGANPGGPWGLCTAVPPVIYTIPPSCPIYPVRFCHVYGHNADEVFVGYTPGYVGCYVNDGVVVYGTGFAYSAWSGRMYFPRPVTFGLGVRYNSYTGHWGFTFGHGWGGGSSWIGKPDRPWGRGGGWFGYGGYRPASIRHDIGMHLAPNEVQRTEAQQRRDSFSRNLYERRGDIRRDEPAHVVSPEIRQAEPRADLRNDVLIDHNGDVHRKTIDGWESHDNKTGQWQPEPRQVEAPRERPEPAPARPPERQPEHVDQPRPQEPARIQSDMNRDYNARVVGEQRSNSYARPAPPPPAPERSGGGGGGRGGGRR